MSTSLQANDLTSNEGLSMECLERLEQQQRMKLITFFAEVIVEISILEANEKSNSLSTI